MHEEGEEYSREMAEKQAFFEIVSEYGDAGIRSFEAAVRSACRQLEEEYSGKPIEEVDEVLLAEKLDELNDEVQSSWYYNNDRAKVTGCLYMVDEEFRYTFPQEWGEPKYDQQNEEEVYFIVEDQNLYSKGVEIAPLYASDGTTIESFQAYYYFSVIPDIDRFDDEEFMLYAYVGKLDEQVYDRPTPEELDRQLSRGWPEEYKYMEELLRSGSQQTLPDRLGLLGRRLQPKLLESPEFTTFVEQYIAEHVDFDRELPYILTVRNQFRLWVGGDVYDLDDLHDSEKWTPCTLQEDMPVLGYRPEIVLITTQDGAIQPELIVSLYNSESDTPEHIRISVENIDNFMSTRATHSLGLRALQASVDGLPVSAAEAAVTTASVPIIESETGQEKYLDRIKAYENIEKAFQKIAAEQSGENKQLYSSAEEAQSAARIMAQRLVGEIQPYQEAYSYAGMDVSGEVLVPNASFLSSITDDTSEFAVSANQDNPVELLENGDSLSVTHYTFIARPKPVLDSNNEKLIGFTPEVGIIAHLSAESVASVIVSGAPLVEFQQIIRVYVPLNETTQIELAPLERYRSIQKQLHRVDNEYANTPLRQHIYELYNELTSEDDMAHKPLQQPVLLEEISRSIHKLGEQGLDMGPALHALDTLLVDRSTRVKGTPLNKKPSFTNGNSSRKEVGGTIVDIRSDIVADDLTLVVKTEQPTDAIYNIPFRTITDFWF